MPSTIHLNDLLPYSGNKMIVFKKEKLPDGQEVTIVFYQSLTNKEWEQGLVDPKFFEIRGIVFDEQGNCICRPFEKFFNVGQVAWASWDDLPSDAVFDCQEKKDGTLINPILLKNGEILWKTKKSHFSEAADWANREVTQKVVDLAKYTLKEGLTANFEYMTPRWKVVVDYGPNPIFSLLAIRDIQSGVYLDATQCQQIADKFGVEYVLPKTKTKAELQKTAVDLEGAEGFVITRGSFRAKLKTQWYVHKHYSETDLRFRDVADAVVDESFDDLLALIVSQKEVALAAELTKIEQQVSAELAAIRQSIVEYAAPLLAEKDFKKVFEALKSCPVQKLVLRYLRGASIESQEEDIKKHWKYTCRLNYPLIAIVNSNFK